MSDSATRAAAESRVQQIDMSIQAHQLAKLLGLEKQVDGALEFYPDQIVHIKQALERVQQQAHAEGRAAGLREAKDIIMTHCPHLFEEGSIHASNGVREAVNEIEARAGEVI